MIDNRQGMNLIEIVLAVSILALAVLPIAGMLDYTNRGTREQDAEGIAANLAKEEMNRLMYVFDRINLLDGAPGPKVWSYGGSVNKKGNEFTGEYSVYEHANGSLNFQIPQMVFHDPLLCSAGGEENDGVAGGATGMNIATVYPDIAHNLLVDIMLRVRWKLPGRDFEPQNELILLGRRAFLVKN